MVVHALEPQMQNVNFVKTGCTRWYLVNNNSLLSNNRFCFQGNVVIVTHMWESMCIVFAPILKTVISLFELFIVLIELNGAEDFP
jgi:hypothetical protein